MQHSHTHKAVTGHIEANRVTLVSKVDKIAIRIAINFIQNGFTSLKCEIVISRLISLQKEHKISVSSDHVTHIEFLYKAIRRPIL